MRCRNIGYHLTSHVFQLVKQRSGLRDALCTSHENFPRAVEKRLDVLRSHRKFRVGQSINVLDPLWRSRPDRPGLPSQLDKGNPRQTFTVHPASWLLLRLLRTGHTTLETWTRRESKQSRRLFRWTTLDRSATLYDLLDVGQFRASRPGSLPDRTSRGFRSGRSSASRGEWFRREVVLES